MTLELAVVAIVGSLLLGTLVSLARLSSFAPLRSLAAAYVDFVRCVPLLVHAMFWYFGATELLPDAAKAWLYDRDASMIAGSIALIVYSAAFVSEDIRSGIRSISRGQVEAARALGFGFLRTFVLVILPQAISGGDPAADRPDHDHHQEHQHHADDRRGRTNQRGPAGAGHDLQDRRAVCVRDPVLSDRVLAADHARHALRALVEGRRPCLRSSANTGCRS
ncbi:amino acid ABC transporter permease [Variovorax ginsengisoli]|uniref:Amino acid ABC transporter permease n=1 Tax=Variovorax ginsengisoli TaxID=363844 RepID=A0ABT8SCN7_9BURK|nr:amino acid ABC transporter permease [Variovorax ginsengisoli]MDN8617498.1 amino acid ABC transporter permease [Variovorax ginsengisoli]MDO1536668.1 amino acid ABC transporter permease [Variovorax ginsengisoli]